MPITERIQRLEAQVCDEESFLTFVVALGEDWRDERQKDDRESGSPYAPGTNGWENGTIGAFLEAASAWAVATKRGTEIDYTPSNVWRRCAQILHAGKFYE